MQLELEFLFQKIFREITFIKKMFLFLQSFFKTTGGIFLISLFSTRIPIYGSSDHNLSVREMF